MPLVIRTGTLVPILALSLFWAVPTLASEMAKFEVDFFEKGSPQAMNHAIVWVSARRIRVEQRAPGASASEHVLIYRGDQDRFLSIHPRARSYSEVQRERVTRLRHEARRARRAVETQLQALPRDQRKAFERLLGVTRQGPEMTENPVIVTPDDVAETVSGFECGRVTLTRGEEHVGRACIAPWRKLGITQADMEAFRELGNFQRDVMGARGLTPAELVPDQPLDLLVQFDGFPLYYQRTIQNRQRSAIQVRTVEMLPTNDVLFEVPDGYDLRPGHAAFLRHLGLGSSPASSATP